MSDEKLMFTTLIKYQILRKLFLDNSLDISRGSICVGGPKHIGDSPVSCPHGHRFVPQAHSGCRCSQSSLVQRILPERV